MTKDEEKFITSLYLGFLERAPDQGGLEYWGGRLNAAQALGQAGYEKELMAIIADFEDSQEFNATIDALVAQVGPTPPVSGDVDINGNPIPDTPTGGVGTIVCPPNANPGPGPGPCGAYEIAVGTASEGMAGANAITRAFLWVLEDLKPGSVRLGNTLAYALANNAAMVWRFKTGKAGDYPALPYPLQFSIAELTSRGPTVPPFITLSTKKLDFDYSKALGNFQAGGYQSGVAGPTILCKVFAEPVSAEAAFPYCPLLPDTTYYLNIRWENAVAAKGQISCPANVCAMTININ